MNNSENCSRPRMSLIWVAVDQFLEHIIYNFTLVQRIDEQIRQYFQQQRRIFFTAFGKSKVKTFNDPSDTLEQNGQNWCPSIALSLPNCLTIEKSEV